LAAFVKNTTEPPSTTLLEGSNITSSSSNHEQSSSSSKSKEEENENELDLKGMIEKENRGKDVSTSSASGNWQLEKDEHMLYSPVGTSSYAAAELILGTGYTFSVDIWSFGVVIFELLSGRLPFRGGNPVF